MKGKLKQILRRILKYNRNNIAIWRNNIDKKIRRRKEKKTEMKWKEIKNERKQKERWENNMWVVTGLHPTSVKDAASFLGSISITDPYWIVFRRY